MSSCAKLLCGAALVLLFGTSAHGSQFLVQASQPLLIDSGLGIGNVTFLCDEDPAKHPELEVLLTVKPGFVTALGDSAATTLNRNAAALARFELHFPKGAVDSSGARFPGLHGDTLVVVLDVSGAFLPSAAGSENEVVLPELSGERFDELVVKTADCLLLNARRRWPRIRHLALSIDGSHHYEHWEGVHSLKNVGGMGAPGDSQETSAPKK